VRPRTAARDTQREVKKDREEREEGVREIEEGVKIIDEAF
jgi:hypothetical protein